MIDIQELLAQAAAVNTDLEAIQQRERELMENPDKAEQPKNSNSDYNNEYNIFNCKQFRPRTGTNAVLLVGAINRNQAVEMLKEQRLGEPMPFPVTQPDYYWIHRMYPGTVAAIPVKRSFGVTYSQKEQNCFSHVHLVQRLSNWNVRCYPRPPVPDGYQDVVMLHGTKKKKEFLKTLPADKQGVWEELAPAEIYCCNPEWEFATHVVDLTDYIYNDMPLDSLSLLPWMMPKSLVSDHRLAMQDADGKQQFKPVFQEVLNDDGKLTGKFKLVNQAGLFGAIETFFKNDPSTLKYIPGSISPAMPFAMLFDFTPKDKVKYSNVRLIMLGRDDPQQSVPDVQAKFLQNFGHFFVEVANSPIFDKIAYTSPEDLQKHFDDMKAGRIPVYKSGHSGPVNKVAGTNDTSLSDNSARLAAIRKVLATNNEIAICEYLDEEGDLTLSAKVEAGEMPATDALIQHAKRVLPADDATAIEAEINAMQRLGLQSTPKPILGNPTEFGASMPNLVDDLI